MDIIQHTAHGYIIGDLASRALGGEPYISFSAALFGALPDIIGYIGLKIKGDWTVYERFHKLNWLCLHPAYLFHILLDKPLHGEIKWWKEGLVFEILGWLLILAYYD